MREHGILMQDEMVRALLRPVGDPLRKTVTRRTSDQWARRSVGDLLWVRECHARPVVQGGVVFRSDHPGDLRPSKPWFSVGWVPGIHMRRDQSRILLRVVSLRREHAAPSSITHRWVGEGPPDPQPAAVYLYGRALDVLERPLEVPGYARAPHPYEPLPWVDDAEARREGVEDRAAYLRLWESINGAEYPTWVWRIEFEEVSRG